MGIYDRDYYREPQPGWTVRAPRSMVATLILINVAVFLANWLLTPAQGAAPGQIDPHTITGTLAAYPETLSRPWMWWQFLTYGFAHDPKSVWHILFNMLQLWFLGRAVEQLYGRGEFLRVYLVMIVLGSLVWAISCKLSSSGGALIGASGAISGVVILFVLNYPRQTLLLFPIPIPIKAWVVGVLLVVGNLAGALGQVGNTAFGVHLTGIAFAYLYFRNRWNLSLLGRRLFSRRLFRPRPRLRIHRPADDEAELSREVDRILEKIHRQGEASLTRRERRTLESASREYQRRRQVGEP